MVGLKGFEGWEDSKCKIKLNTDYGRIERQLVMAYLGEIDLLNTDYGRIERWEVDSDMGCI